MFARSKIRTQMYLGLALLVVAAVVLSGSGIHGAAKFRELTKNIRTRMWELPRTAELNRSIADLRVAFSQLTRPAEFGSVTAREPTSRSWALAEFVERMRFVRIALKDYHEQLLTQQLSDPRIADITSELSTVGEIVVHLDQIDGLILNPDLVFNDYTIRCQLDDEIECLQPLVGLLPGFLKARIDGFSDQVRGEYYSWMLISCLFLVVAIILLVRLVTTFRKLIFKPLEGLIAGSRRVAQGEYEFRIRTQGVGELQELATAFNEMTHRFYEIKTDLDEQVRQRTQEIVRKEQLASVGFLAAGVAHEINNPLAAIAWSAESLEMRLDEILASLGPVSAPPESIEQMRKYLQRIQGEAFRCKDITAGLLDFSRLGDARKTETDLRSLVEGIVEMVRPLDKYRDRTIELSGPSLVLAEVNPQEMKQVVLNLVANALDSLSPGGCVRIRLTESTADCQLIVEDNGCGMDAEVQQHLFEPFFTRRADGSGTGLGLSITYRIIEEHGGSIRAFSPGVGRGSRFTVTLPRKQHAQKQKQLAA